MSCNFHWQRSELKKKGQQQQHFEGIGVILIHDGCIILSESLAGQIQKSIYADNYTSKVTVNIGVG